MKKGFTLVELLAVIVLLGIIGLIATPTVTNVIKNNKEKALNHQKELIIRAARNWANANSFNISENEMVSVNTLQSEGYLENINIDEIDYNDCVKITKQKNKYTFTFEEKCETNTESSSDTEEIQAGE